MKMLPLTDTTKPQRERARVDASALLKRLRKTRGRASGEELHALVANNADRWFWAWCWIHDHSPTDHVVLPLDVAERMEFLRPPRGKSS